MKTNTNTHSNTWSIWKLSFGALAIAGVSSLLTVFILSYSQKTAVAQPTIPTGVSLTSWFDNGKGGQHVLQVAEGSVPPLGIRVVGTVTSDTDRDPDPQGLNHCRNNIDLGNGRSIAAIHHHAMNRYPCLEVGQKLTLVRLNGDWVVGYEPQAAQTN